MKTQNEATIQFSGYPLSIAKTPQKIKTIELTVIKSSPGLQLPSSENSIANDPKNWDVDWFNSYE